MDESCNSSIDDEFTFILNDRIHFLPGKRCIVSPGGTVIGLSENSYRFLLLLLNGETDKQKIINLVWREQRGSVSDSSYYGQIYMLRKAFCMAGLPSSLIKTIPRKGVKYMGKVGKVKNQPVLKIKTGETPLTESEEYLPQQAVSLNYDVLPVKNGTSSVEKSRAQNDWFNSKHWNLLISILAVLAVCWLTSLAVGIIYLFF